jgi:hypothetical protein
MSPIFLHLSRDTRAFFRYRSTRSFFSRSLLKFFRSRDFLRTSPLLVLLLTFAVPLNVVSMQVSFVTSFRAFKPFMNSLRNNPFFMNRFFELDSLISTLSVFNFDR